MMVQSKFAILKRPGLDVVIEHASADAPTNLALPGDAAFVDCVGDSTNVKWPRTFHIGLEFPTLDNVRDLRKSLMVDGFIAETEVFNNERGSRFFLRAPGGVMVEFNTRADAAEAFLGTFEN